MDTGGQPLANRDVLRITGWQGEGPAREAVAQRQLDEPDAEGRRWSDEFTVPTAYLEENAELAYAGNVFVARGRTVDTSHLVVSKGMTRDLLYVGMTRGRERNQAHVVTGPPDPANLSREERDAFAEAAFQRVNELYRQGDLDAMRAVQFKPPEPKGMRERNTWESVIADAMERDELAGTAIEAMRAAQEFPVHTRHLYEIREAYWWKDIAPRIDDMVRQRIRWDDYQRYLNDPERPAFLQELRRHEIGGRPIGDVLDSITARPLEGARSVAAVLHGRAGKEPAPARGDTTTWAERTGEASEVIQEADTELDRRQSELGEQLAAQPPHWALEAWGVPRTEAGKLRDDWMQRAALMGAEVDPEALTVVAAANTDMAAISRSEFDDNLARAQAGAEQLAAQRAHNQAERDRAAVDEPVIQAEAEAQAELEAAAAANPDDRAETDDIGLEI